MSSEHTPGPWIADTSRQHSGHARVDGTEKLICSVGNGESPDVAFGEWSANARLIAAAPDLLEIVKRAQAVISTEIYPNWHASASAAIDKATP